MTAAATLESLHAEFGRLRGGDLLAPMIRDIFPGRIALVSSFGAESAVLLDMVARIDPDLPVIFLDTGKLFGETIRHRRTLAKTLGLTDVRDIRPDPASVEAEDRNGLLWTRDPDACCALRKVRPLETALAGFDAWITGRKRFQSESRAGLPAIEQSGGRFKLNPLVDWGFEALASYMDRRGLPRHPLVADGYVSIGCMPCTRRPRAGDGYRDGRWAGSDKTECGIHVGENI